MKYTDNNKQINIQLKVCVIDAEFGLNTVNTNLFQLEYELHEVRDLCFVHCLFSNTLNSACHIIWVINICLKTNFFLFWIKTWSSRISKLLVRFLKNSYNLVVYRWMILESLQRGTVSNMEYNLRQVRPSSLAWHLRLFEDWLLYPYAYSRNRGHYLLFFEFTIPLHVSLPFNTGPLSARNVFTAFLRW